MAKIKLTLCDDQGNPIAGIAAKDYTLEVGQETLDEIETAVEKFKLEALPKIEADLLNVAQERLTEQVKKKDSESRTEKP